MTDTKQKAKNKSEKQRKRFYNFVQKDDNILSKYMAMGNNETDRKYRRREDEKESNICFIDFGNDSRSLYGMWNFFIRRWSEGFLRWQEKGCRLGVGCGIQYPGDGRSCKTL